MRDYAMLCHAMLCYAMHARCRGRYDDAGVMGKALLACREGGFCVFMQSPD